MQRIPTLAGWLLTACIVAAALLVFALSLNHPITADLAMLHYSAWLINERDFVVYRDIFELNFPGPFLFHCLLGKVAGYEALPLRLVDLALLLTLAYASWQILADLSRPAALTGTALFTLVYLFNGGEYVLERDVLGLVPAALAFAISSRPAPLTRRALLASGALSAAACSMKPNAIVLLPVLLWLLWQHSSTLATDRPRHLTFLRMLLVFFSAMLVVAAIPFAWVLQSGGLPAFLAIYRDFVPVYANSRYDLWHYDSAAERWQFLLDSYLRFGGAAWLLSGAGLVRAWCTTAGMPVQRRRIGQLALMSGAYTFYEVIAGKFWVNHLFPSAYWTLLCFALLLTLPTTTASRAPSRLACRATLLLLLPVAALAWVTGQYSLTRMTAAHEQERTHPMAWRARQIAHYLQQQALQADDRVQVLGMAGDAQATLLMARATSATRHLIDVPLYMQPASAATRTLRQELIDQLTTRPPRFVIFYDEFLHPGGGNRLNEFRPLAAWLEANYEIAQQADGEYTLYRRKF